MNRELKFRAWDKRQKKWVYFTLLDIYLLGSKQCMLVEGIISDCSEHPAFSDLIHWSQYIGQIDVHCNKIYEGDIIYSINLNTKSAIESIVNVGLRLKEFEKCVVIGNIYENPNL